MKENKIYEARVEEVHSGDDFILMVNLGVDGLFKKVRARLYGVDAPNAFKSSPTTEAGVVRDEVRKLVVGKCRIELVAEGKGGWIVRLFIQQGADMVCLNDILRSRGYVYTPPKQGNSQ